MRSGIPTVGEQIRRIASEHVVGRTDELSRLARLTEPDQPVVTFVHGLGGVGKTALLSALVPRLQTAGARVLLLDGRQIEPTPRGLLDALGAAWGAQLLDAAAFAEQLMREARPCVLAIDNFEALHLVESWLRRELVVAMPASSRVLLFGRHGPSTAWLTTPGWAEATGTLRLGPLTERASRALLAARGVPVRAMDRWVKLAQGHPLTLQLAASLAHHAAVADAPGDSELLEALAARCLEDVTDARVRTAIEAMCVVRRSTRPLLSAMLGRELDDALLDALLGLPFVERAEDGIRMHESVRQAFEARLCAIDPPRYRSLRSAAWLQLRAALTRRPSERVAWQDTADVLFLVRHPEIREAFFPTARSSLTVERALSTDAEAVFAIVQRHEPREAHSILKAWWEALPDRFSVVRDARGTLRGFSVLAPSRCIPDRLLEQDPLLRAWHADVAQRHRTDREALYARRVLCAERGEGTSDAQASLWVDAKRAYVEHPMAGSVYIATRSLAHTLPLIARLGFRDAAIRAEQAGSCEDTLRLDFGAQGMWSWLTRIVDAHEEAQASWSLDEATRSLMVDGARVQLSPLEYGALNYLVVARGRVVTRDELLTQVWKQQHGGSNVVDALIRLVRRKLGPHAAALETVKGFGYRIARS